MTEQHGNEEILHKENGRYEDVLLTWVAQQWPIPDILGVEAAAGREGKVNRLHLADGSRRYLKRLPSEDRANLETEIYGNLQRAGVRTSVPFITNSGRSWAMCGEHPYMLTEELPGVVQDEVQPEEGIVYGRELAKLHNGLAALDNQIPYPDMDLGEQLTGWAIPGALSVAGEIPALTASLNELASDMSNAWFPDLLPYLPKQPIHRDPHPGNMVLTEDGSIGFLDFEISVRGVRLFDICYFCTSQWIREYSPNKEAGPWLGLVEGVRKGYEQISPLSEEERKSVYYVMCSIQLIFAAFFQSIHKPEAALMNLDALLGLMRHRSGIERIFE
jgi:Ser/Thr protein kinase RdoA (MazF antagonist)